MSDSNEKRSSKFEEYSRSPYVRGLPEWDLFPDAAARDRAIREIERGMVPRSLSQLVKFLVFVVPLALLPFVGLHYVLKWIHPAPFWGSGWIPMIGGVLIYVILIYILLRRAMPRDLRKQLVKAGVPICLKCGYALKGLPADREKCPECGRRLSERIRDLLGR